MANEPIPTLVVLTLLEDNWDEGDVIKPQLIEVNAPNTNKLRLDLTKGDAVLIKLGAGRNERWRGNWSWKDIVDYVEIEMFTKESRQRLYNINAEIRKIIEANMHSLNDYHVIRYSSFNENTDKELNFWRGTAKISLESNAIATERTCP